MTTPARLTDPVPLERLPSLIRQRLPELATMGGRFREWLAEFPVPLVLCVVALDAEGVIGWSAAHLGERTVGVFVAPDRRRKGIGTRLMYALCAAVRERWPEIEWSTSTAPGSAGRRFMAAHDRHLRRAS